MSRSVVARSLEPLAASLWGFFLAWTALLAVAWVGAIDEFWLKANVSNAGLRDALVMLFNSVMPAWIALGVANVHLAVSREEGLKTARHWLRLVLGFSFLLGVIAANTNVLFGRAYFSAGLGVRLVGVPVGWALLWVLVLIGARELVLWLRPRAAHHATAFAGGALVALTFVNLEPLAQHFTWWFWRRDKFAVATALPWHFTLVIMVFAVVLGWLLREISIVPRTKRRSRKAAIIFLLLNAVAIAAHLRLWLFPPQSSPVEISVPM